MQCWQVEVDVRRMMSQVGANARKQMEGFLADIQVSRKLKLKVLAGCMFEISLEIIYLNLKKNHQRTL